VSHELTDEQRDIRDLARRFADEVVAPHAAQWDRDHTFPREVFAQLGELGLMGVCVPDRYAGAGADYLSYALVLEELSRADAGVGVTLAVHTGAGTMPVLQHGSDDQRDRVVPPLAQGHELAAFALTESGSGSDAGSDARALRRRGGHDHRHEAVDHQRLVRALLPRLRQGGRQADRLPRAPRRPRVPGHARGGEDGPALLLDRRPGLRGHAGRARRPAGGGMRIALSTLDGGRIGIAAQAVGIAQAALDVATAYAKERTAFGGPIGRFQAVGHKLADMQTEIEAARALVWRAARLKDAGKPHTVEGAQAKLFASRVARHWTGEAIQVLGGYGYTKEFPAERFYRDAKVTEIYEGTSEIQRLVIARGLLGAL
jgi:alkylation response protein AidB-like acyl-CoA dehydrogenase